MCLFRCFYFCIVDWLIVYSITYVLVTAQQSLSVDVLVLLVGRGLVDLFFIYLFIYLFVCSFSC